MHKGLTTDIAPIGPAKDAHGQFCPPRAHQAGDAHHLALAHVDADIVDHLAFIVDRMVDVPVLYFKNYVADIGCPLGKAMGQITTDHAADDAIFGNGVGATVKRLNGGAIAQDRDGIGHLGDFVELVGNQNRRNALRLELQQAACSSASVSVSLRLAVGSSRIKQFALLWTAPWQSRPSCCFPTPRSVTSVVGNSFRPTILQQRLRLRNRLVPIDDAAGGLLVTQKNILCNRQERGSAPVPDE